MTTTATYGFDPALDVIYAEAFERAGVDPAGGGGRHLTSMFRSLQFMLNSEWATLGKRQWMIPQDTQATTVGMQHFDLPAGAIDLVGAVLRRAGKDTEMYPMSRDEYLTLVDKTLQGRPDRYFVDRQAALKRVFLWRAGENTTDIIVYNYFRQIQDPGNLQNTLQLPAYAQEAMVAGLSAKLALKFNVPKFAVLQSYYWGTDTNKPGGCVKRLLEEDRERADIELIGMYEPRTARR